jgi:hypothetical protein
VDGDVDRRDDPARTVPHRHGERPQTWGQLLVVDRDTVLPHLGEGRHQLLTVDDRLWPPARHLGAFEDLPERRRILVRQQHLAHRRAVGG